MIFTELIGPWRLTLGCLPKLGKNRKTNELAHLQSEGMDINPEDRARLSPLQHKHIHVLGRHSFALADPIASGELRPLNVEGWEDEA